MTSASIKSQLISTSKITILALAVTLGTNVLLAAWQAPTEAPPNGNVPAPLNAGSVSQYKQGALSLGTTNSPATGSMLDVIGTVSANSLLVNGPSYFAGHLKIADGTQGAGKILTSDANGNAAWAPAPVVTPPPPITNAFNGVQLFDKNGVWTAPAGITKVMIEICGASAGHWYTRLSNSAKNSGPSLPDLLPGGIGGYGRGVYSVVPGQVYVVTIGKEGGSSAPGSNNYNHDATDGGRTSFGNIVYATGGQISAGYATGPTGTTNATLNFPVGAGYECSVSSTDTNNNNGKVIVYW